MGHTFIIKAPAFIVVNTCRNTTNIKPLVNVGFSSCFSMNQLCFLNNRTNSVEIDRLSTGYSWLHQVLKKMFSKQAYIHIKCIRKCLSKQHVI